MSPVRGEKVLFMRQLCKLPACKLLAVCAIRQEVLPRGSDAGRRKSLDAAVGGELSGKYGLRGIDLQFKRLIAHSGEVERSRGQKEPSD